MAQDFAADRRAAARWSTAPGRRPAPPTSASRTAASSTVGTGRRAGRREVIDADGLLVTPGFVDIHTHYDGQATWDDRLAPSAWHGVTTVVMGNCGVGFAPVRPADHDRLIELMEGVEDIPGAALHEGLAVGLGVASPSTSTRSTRRPLRHRHRRPGAPRRRCGST